jgi:drug/metabolite transporter (DMT)-like permease
MKILTPVVLELLAFCVTAETVQQISFKLGSTRPTTSRTFYAGIVGQPLIWLGVALWVVESMAWIHVLQRAPLSLAYPIMTLTYVGVPLAGMLLLKERMTPRQILGGALIALGVACVALSEA